MTRPFVFVTDLSPSLNISGAANNSVVNLAGGEVELVCHADGNPPPTYQWLELNSDESKDGPTYTIKTAGQYSLQCTASNNVTSADGNAVPHSVSARFYLNGMFFLAVLSSHLQLMVCLLYTSPSPRDS